VTHGKVLIAIDHFTQSIGIISLCNTTRGSRLAHVTQCYTVYSIRSERYLASV